MAEYVGCATGATSCPPMDAPSVMKAKRVLILLPSSSRSRPCCFGTLFVDLGFDFLRDLSSGWQRRNVVYWNPNGRSSMISCAIKSFKRHSQGMSLFMVCVFVF